MGLVYCDICHGTVSQGFGVGRIAAINAMSCKNCKANRCSKCSVGRYCKRCLHLLSPEIQQKALKLHGISKTINNIFNVIFILDIIYLILLKLGAINLDGEMRDNVLTIALIIFIVSIPFIAVFNIIMTIYQNIFWESNLKKE